MSVESPIVVTALFHPATGKRDALLAALQAHIPRVHEEAGCLLYAIQEDSDGEILLIAKWDSAETLDAHEAGTPVADFVKDLTGVLDGPVDVAQFTPIAVGDPAKGAV